MLCMSADESLPSTIGRDAVHLWHTRLDARHSRLQQLNAVLSAGERARAARFVFPRDRRRFTVARGFLRETLARYLPCDACDVRLDESGGKPEVTPARGVDPLRFSLSHAGDLVVIGVTRGRHIGIDVEAVRPLSDLDAIARDVFSPREHVTWSALPGHQREEAFFHAWTRKEAWLKAIGVGLAVAPSRVEVSFRPDGAARLISVDEGRFDHRRWSLLALRPAAGHVGALAVEGSDWRLVACQ